LENFAKNELSGWRSTITSSMACSSGVAGAVESQFALIGFPLGNKRGMGVREWRVVEPSACLNFQR
jgi:hypothetical protein